MHLLLLQETILGKRDVHLGYTHQSFGYSFDDQVVEANLDGSRVSGGILVNLLAQGSQLVRVDNAGDVEVRRGLHTLTETLSDGAAHGCERNLQYFASVDCCRSQLWREGRCRLNRLCTRDSGNRGLLSG